MCTGDRILNRQWGRATGVANGKSYTYPITFTNSCLSVGTNKNSKGGYGAADGNSAGIELIDKTSFYAYADDGTATVTYIAVGY